MVKQLCCGKEMREETYPDQATNWKCNCGNWICQVVGHPKGRDII